MIRANRVGDWKLLSPYSKEKSILRFHPKAQALLWLIHLLVEAEGVLRGVGGAEVAESDVGLPGPAKD